jgi:hypothetical protein
LPRRFFYYFMAFFIGAALLAGSLGALRPRLREKPAGPLWSEGTAIPPDGSLIRLFSHHPLLPNPTASTIGTRPPLIVHAQENLERHPVLRVPLSPTRHEVFRPGSQAGGSGDRWTCIRTYESGGNYSENSGNGYYGAYQFSAASWRSVGGTGLPSNAPPAEQDARARTLQQRGGWSQWPSSSRMCSG